MKMKINLVTKLRIAALATFLLAGPGLEAQPFTRLKSPVINADHTVTFLLDAGDARQVELMFGPEMARQPFEKDEQGI
jgi:hypothetical protein